MDVSYTHSLLGMYQYLKYNISCLKSDLFSRIQQYFMTIEGYLAHGEIDALKYVSGNYGGGNGGTFSMDHAQNSF